MRFVAALSIPSGPRRRFITTSVLNFGSFACFARVCEGNRILTSRAIDLDGDPTHIKVNWIPLVLVILLRGAVRLHPFLLSQLERAADHTAEARAEPGISRAEMHPVLYPILLLLARLKAGGGSNGMEAEQAEVTAGGGREYVTRHLVLR